MKIRVSKLDILFSKFVKLRAGGKCEYCGGAGNQTSHFHSRRKRSVRHDPDNAIWSCFSCHQYLDEHPNKHTDFFSQRLGSERFEQLNIRAEKVVKVSKSQEQELIRYFKEKIRAYEASIA